MDILWGLDVISFSRGRRDTNYSMARLIWSGEGSWEMPGILSDIMFARREDMEAGAEVGSSTDPPRGILFHDNDNE